MTPHQSRVAYARTTDRRAGTLAALEALDATPVNGKHVLIKPNFNTADPAPASTDNETLLAIVDWARDHGARSVAVGDRSYVITRSVFRNKGLPNLLAARNARVCDFDDLAPEDWVAFPADGTHWPEGFRVARPILEAECLIYSGCIKTHQYGGVFTMSLKLSVGVVPASRNGFQYMTHLHHSPHQRLMIAEINKPFTPDLVVLDGVDAFVDGGPATGRRVRAETVLAADNRVAADAAGLAVLKRAGANQAIMDTPIFAQEQIARAVEIGLGPAGPEGIRLFPVDGDSEAACEDTARLLAAG